MALTLSILAVPVLYVLSAPPIIYGTASLTGRFPAWAKLYGRPYEWFGDPPERSRVGDTLTEYKRWWRNRFPHPLPMHGTW